MSNRRNDLKEMITDLKTYWYNDGWIDL